MGVAAASRAGRIVVVLGLCATMLPALAADASAADGDDRRHGYAVAEHDPPLCSARFCVHWVESTADAPDPADSDADGVPDEVAAISAEFEATYDRQTGPGGLGWREPPRDGTAGGGTDKIDVYVKAGSFKGRTWVHLNEGGGRSQAAYVLVAPRLARDVLRYVAPHEFAHVIQYGYDASAPHWLHEASATWTEFKLVPELDSWQRHLTAWARDTESSPFGGSDHYGSAVWIHWLEGRFGTGIVRGVWERLAATAPETGDLEAFDQVLREHGAGGLAEEHGRFAAALPEWRRAQSGFPRPSTLPEVERRGTVTPDAGATHVDLPGGGLALLDVPVGAQRALRLDAALRPGLPGTIALVGRSGDPETGRTVTATAHLPEGGAGSVTLTADEPLARVTAVLVDSHPYTVEGGPPPPTARITTLARFPAAGETTPGTPSILLPGATPCCAVTPGRGTPRRRPGPVRALRARRRGRTLTLTWTRAARATSYRVAVRDGRRLVRRTVGPRDGRRLRLRIRGRSVRVSVAGFNEAGRGPAGRLRARW